MIPSFNADDESMEATTVRLASLHGIEKIELLPFHKLATGKCESLGREYAARDSIPPPSKSCGGTPPGLLPTAFLFSIITTREGTRL